MDEESIRIEIAQQIKLALEDLKNELNEDKVYNKNGIVILDEEVDENKKILLQDMKGDALKGKQLIITAAGLEHSL